MNQSQSAEQLRKYAQEKVIYIYGQLMEELLTQQPQNIIDWSITWLDKKGRMLVEQNELQMRKKSKQKNESSNSSSDDEIIELPKRPIQARQQRASISAECYGVFNKKENFVARVIAKNEEQRQRIENKLNQSFMFQALEQKEKVIVIDAMEEKHYQQGDFVIQQGENGDNLYVVDTGELDCSKHFTKDGEETYLKTYYSGDSFGELALLYNAPRAATIKCKTDSVLFALDRLTFNHIVKDAAMKKREKYVNVLKSIELLSMMDPYERSHVADGIKSSYFNAGDYIIREGEEGDIFYMVEEGNLVATKTLEVGKSPVKVYEYKAGDYFGELALLKNIPRQANIVAENDVKLIYLDRHCFKRMLGPLEDILKRNADKYEKYEQFWRERKEE